MLKLFELLVISGKGGTGKTSVAASLAALAGRSIIADCDVDAADLHLVLNPAPCSSERFIAGHFASLDATRCNNCAKCFDLCRAGAVKFREGPKFYIDEMQCEGCGVCVRFCPVKAIDFKSRDCGELMASETRFGPMAHARLKPGGENSGKLVAAVKEKAHELAGNSMSPLMIVDGPPGIGCPVIAATSGASLALLVTEPTLSAEHDLLRAIKLLKQFNVPGALCVNKWDINPELTAAIEKAAAEMGIPAAGRIRYDVAISKAQAEAKAVVEMDAPSCADFYALWDYLNRNTAMKGILK
jgi:MinD superfamily P-loop ATPase